MFNTGPVFQANYESTADIVVNQGGTDSGKTYSLIQLAAFICCSHQAPSVDPVFTVLSESVPNSKKGAYRVFESIATNPWVSKNIAHWDRGGRVITFKTGWILEFLGATDEQNAKQGKRQYLFVNEANGITWPIFWQMAKRTRIRVFIDYNPSAPFWAHDKLIGTVPEGNDLSAVVQLIISDHRHNPYLSERDHKKTESIQDPELFRVYARGLTGNLSGLIFTNWQMVQDEEFPMDSPVRFGAVDFGYTNDPTAALDIAVVGNKVYLHELCYEPDLTEEQLKQLYTARGYTSSTIIYCEHDQTIIRNLRKLKVKAFPALKGPNSIVAGIQLIRKQFKMHYTVSSGNIPFELKRYMWEKDPITNKPTNTPIDQYNHLMDATRYGLFTKYFRSRS
jgi:phage terminase large subunit